MPAITALLIGALAVSAVGVGVSAYSAYQQSQAQKAALSQQQQIEAQRQQQMNLEAERQKRAIVRQSLTQRAQAESGAAAGGASYGSGLQGAYGNIEGAANTSELGVNQNKEIGNNIFSLHANQLSDYRDAAGWAGIGSIGGGLTSLGGAVLNNLGQINKIGTYLTS